GIGERSEKRVMSLRHLGPITCWLWITYNHTDMSESTEKMERSPFGGIAGPERRRSCMAHPRIYDTRGLCITHCRIGLGRERSDQLIDVAGGLHHHHVTGA